MKENQPVIIQQVSNGFKLSSWIDHGISAVPEDAVFQSFTELVQFLSEHFDFRNMIIKSDPYPIQGEKHE